MAAPVIRVAVIGGGFAGTVLTHALLRHPHLDVNLYEANAAFQERGASVGLSINAHRALALLGLGDVVERARGVKGVSFRMVICEGTNAGETAVDVEHPLVTVHRAALLRELVAEIPREKIHFNKKVLSIEGNLVEFQDGSNVTADLIVGADGIHSVVRRYLLGDKHPATNPIFSGIWDCRTILPTNLAIAKLGTHRIDKGNPRQHLYSAKNSFFIHDLLDDGEYICIVGGGVAPESWASDQWKKFVSREWLNKIYENWGDFGQTMLDLLCNGQEEVSVFLEWESGNAPRLYSGSLCMIGDAAHATTPWQGNGFAQAVEDSLILSTALGQCTDCSQIPAALTAYDHIMRPRGQRVIESSRGTGLICVGANGFDPEMLQRDLPPRWQFIHEWDTAGAMNEAVAIFEKHKSFI